LEGKVEEGEQALSRVVDALELLLANLCRCNGEVIVTESRALVEESLELEYASEEENKEEEFRTPPLDLMMLVIKGCTL